MPYTLPQAAAAVARDRSTILRMIKAGKLSAARDPANNGWLIEPAELHRMYPAHADAQQRGADAVWEAKLETERAKVVLLERANDDLRRRLDAEAEERRRLTAILADQRAAPAPIRKWWRLGR